MSVDHDLEALARLLEGRRVVALTGAGCSTESGIPDYRGEGTRRRARNPMQYRAFVHEPAARARYWARSLLGWPRIEAARPNAAHHALAELEIDGALVGLITQNVDRLHHAAGSGQVVELHGALAQVRCLACGQLEPRAQVQERLLDANPGWQDRRAELNPDGDVELTDDETLGFRVVSCASCGGVLKPDVVFFGDSVPKARVEAAHAMVAEAEAMLVVGTSLAVYSGLRFVRAAAARGIPVAILNVGETRGDPLAQLRVQARAGEALPGLRARLAGLARRVIG
jgi:NAD+-dependent protein deacetylase sirtuin 4